MKNYDSKYALIKNKLKESQFNFLFIFFLTITSIITVSHADTITSTTDTTVETNVDFNGGVKEVRTYNITNSSVYTINGAIINSSYAITKSGDGTLVFGIDNSSGWSNTLTINAGTVAAGDDDAFGTGTVTLNGGSISSNNTSARSLSNTIQLQNSSSLGNSTNNGTLTLSGGITFLDKNLTLASNSNNTISSIDFGTDPQTISVASGVTSTISGNIGNGNFTKTGSGTMTIAGNYTNNSPFTISAGQVEVTGTLFGGNFSNSISNSGQLNINTTSNQTLAGKISGSGEINKNNSGTLTISSSTNDYTGRTIIEGGTISISSSSNLGITPGSVDNDNITLNNGTLQTTSSFTLGSNKGIMTTGSGGTINTNASTTLSYGGVINGSGSISKTGSGTLSLSGSNTYTGNTTISAGTLTNTGTLSDSTAVSVSSGATYDVDATDTVASIEGTGAIDIAGSQTLTAGDSNNKTFSGVISGAGGFTKAGSGTLVLSGTNTYTGNTTISAGTLAIQGQLESGNYDGTISNSGTLNVNSSSNQTLAGVISGTGSLTKEGSGTLTLSGSNTYSGSTTITAGTISASSSANLGATPGAADGDNIIFNGGTLNTTADFTLGSNKGITMTGNGTINVNSSTTLTFDGIITDSGNLTKSGAGTLVLGGSNQNDGAISVNAGILEISNQYSLGTDTDGTTVANGATLKITDAVTIANEALTLNGTGVSNAGALQTTHSSGTVLLTGSTTLGSDTTINVGNGNLRFDQAIASGSDSYDVTFTGNGGEIRTAGGININSGSVTMSASGTLFSETANSYSGGTTISSGSLLYGANDAFGTGAITMTGGKFYTTDATAYNINENLNIQGSIILGNTGASNSTTFSGTNTLTGNASATIQSSVSMAAIDDGSNSYNFSKLGSGTLTLTGSNGYDGTTTISAGTLTVTGTLDDNTAVTVSSGATYDIDASDTISSLAGAGTIDIASSQTLTVGNSSDQEISGTITGSGAFNKNGTGKLTLSGTGTDVGSIIISNGTIEVSGLLNNGSYSGNITNRSAIIFSSSSNQTISGNIIREGTLTKNGSGILTLSGTNNYAGATTINSGTLTVSGTLSDSTAVTVASGAVYDVDASDTIASVGGAGNIEIASSQTLTAGDSNNKTLSGVISGSGGFTKAGSSTYTLSGTNTYTGNTTISAGTLDISGQLGSGTYAGNISNSGTLTYSSNSDQTFSGVISGTGAINKSGSSTLTLSGTNTYTGNTSISAGTLTVTGSLSDSASVSVESGAIYDVDASDTIASVGGAGNIEIASSQTLTAGDSNNKTLSGVISGSGGFTKAGSSVYTLSGTNTYTGITTINAGTLTVSGTLSDSTAVTVASGAVYDVDASDTIASVGGAGNIEIASSQTLTAGDSNNKTLSGVISGSGGFTKTGSGTQTLSGTNTYSGATTINAGTLTVSGTLSDSTAVTVASGATYDVDASDTITSLDGAGTIEIASSVTLTTGDTNDQELSGTISGSGSLTKAGSGILTLSGTNSYSGNTTISAGTLLVRSQLGEGTYAGNISNSGDFGINSSSDQTLSGVISGSGTINKSGTGELTLTGANTFNGTINVAGGTLFAGTSSDSSNNITQGNIVVKGGTLGGGGVIGGDISFTTTGGTLAPGNSIGTLTVSGDLTLSADDTTEIEFNATSADKIIVNGNTTLAGTISLFPENTTYSDTSLTIVDASAGGTFTGTFATETMNNQSNLNGATWDIVYDTVGKTVKLDLTEATSSSTSIKDTTTINKFKKVATIFDDATTGKFKEIKDVLNSATVKSVNTELGKLKGTVLSSTYVQPTLNHNNFNRALNSVTSSNVNTSLVSSFTNYTDELTLASLQDAGLYGQKDKFNEYYDYSDTSVLGFIKNNKNKSILDNFVSEDRASFIRTYGTTADRDNIGSSYTGYKSETTGILFGQQFKNDDVTFSGYSYGFTGTDTDYKNNYGESKTYSAHASLFRQIDKEDFGLNLISGMYVSKTESERNVSVFGTSVNDKYLSDYWDVGFNQEVQFIKKFNIAGLNLAPSAKLNSTYVVKSDTKETGGELALTIDNENLFIVKPEIGLSIARDFNQKENITNEFSVAVFASQDHFLEGTTSNARFTSGSSFNVDLPRDEETYLSAGLGYNFLNKETDTSLMANAFMMENDRNDMSSNIFSLTFRKLFGEFGKGTIPPVIAKKSENEDIVKIDLPERTEEEIIKEGEKSLEKLEKNIEIVLKDNPSEKEVAEVYKNMSDSLVAKKELTVNDVYNKLTANCSAVEKNLGQLVNYYNKLQLYKILDKCNKLSEPKVHLIAERLHQIQLDETTALQELYYGYLRFLNYLPFISFIAFVILVYEFVRRYVVDHFRSRNAV